MFEESGGKEATLGNVDVKQVLEDAHTSKIEEAKAEPSDYGEDRFEDSAAKVEIDGNLVASGTQSAAVKEETPGSEPT